MADYYEQQRRENQRRFEESQRQQRQWQEQQRRDQERRDQDRRLQERVAAERHAREVERDRQRSNQRVLDQQKHQQEMAEQRAREQKEKERQQKVKEMLNQGEKNWTAPPTSSPQLFFNPAPSNPNATGLQHQPGVPSSGSADPFQAIDDFFWKLIQKAPLPIGAVGAIAGAIVGWHWPPLGDSIAQWKSILGCTLFGIPAAFLVVGLLRQVVKGVLIVAAIAAVCGLGWMLYRLLELLFGLSGK